MPSEVSIARFATPAFVVVFLALIFVLHHHVMELSAGPPPPTIVPDLAFFYKCPISNDMMADDIKIDRFLIENGFQVSDLGERRRDLGLSQFYPQRIAAIDKQKRWIDFSEKADGLNHSVTLESEPPTVHSSKLEQDLLQLISKTLKCQISHVIRDNNPVITKGNYDLLFSYEAAQLQEYHLSRLP